MGIESLEEFPTHRSAELEPPKNYRRLRQESAQKKTAFIFTLDETLALRGDRDPFDYSCVGDDAPNAPVVFVAKHLQLFATILVITDRPERCRWQSETWLHAQGIFFDYLFTRPEDDNRWGDEFWKETYQQKIQPQYVNVVGVFDYSLPYVDMWRELGLFVFDCTQ